VNFCNIYVRIIIIKWVQQMKILMNEQEIIETIDTVVRLYKNTDDVKSKGMLEDDLMKLLAVKHRNTFIVAYKAERMLRDYQPEYTDEDANNTRNRFEEINSRFMNDYRFNVELSRANAEVLVPRCKYKLMRTNSEIFSRQINEFRNVLLPEGQVLFDDVINGNGLVITKGGSNGRYFKIYSLNKKFIEVTQKHYDNRSYGIFCHEFGHSLADDEGYDYSQVAASKDTYLGEVLSILYEILGIELLTLVNPKEANALMMILLDSCRSNALAVVDNEVKDGKFRALRTDCSKSIAAVLLSFFKQNMRYIYGISIVPILLEEKARDELAFRQKLNIMKKHIGYRDDFELLNDIEITRDMLLEQRAYKRLVKKMIK